MKNLQQKVKEFVEKYNLEHSAEISTLDLVTEIGEGPRKSSNPQTTELSLFFNRFGQ